MTRCTQEFLVGKTAVRCFLSKFIGEHKTGTPIKQRFLIVRTKAGDCLKRLVLWELGNLRVCTNDLKVADFLFKTEMFVFKALFE